MPSKKETVLIFLVGTFNAALIISSVTASKLWAFSVASYDVVVPVGTSLFAITFLCTDVIAEVWGKKESILLVYCGLAMRILTLLFFSFAVWIEPINGWEGQEAYASVLGISGSGNIIVAGLIAYSVSQTNDVFVFHHFKKKDTGKNRLWKRNTLSTFSSQFLDSFIFVILAFGDLVTVEQLVSIIVGQIVIKWLIAILDTPFVYLLRNFLTDRKWYDVSG